MLDFIVYLHVHIPEFPEVVRPMAYDTKCNIHHIDCKKQKEQKVMKVELSIGAWICFCIKVDGVYSIR